MILRNIERKGALFQEVRGRRNNVQIIVIPETESVLEGFMPKICEVKPFLVQLFSVKHHYLFFLPIVPFLSLFHSILSLVHSVLSLYHSIFKLSPCCSPRVD